MYSQRILGLLFACILTSISLPLLPGQGSNAQSSTRREVPLAASNMSYVQAALQQLFQGRVYADASNGSRLLLQLHAGSVSVEFLHAEQKLRLEGGQALTHDLATLITAVSKQSPDSTVRILPLNDQGQDSLSSFQLRASRGMQGSENGKFGLASFAGLRRTQLASSSQEPKNETNAPGNNNQPGFQLPPNTPSPLQPPSGPTTPDQKKDGGGQTLPLPQFEGVQIEMLPELDAIILRGRDQQLSDLAEIIKRLDEASKLSKPEIEVIPLSHASSESLGKLVTTLQEKLIGARQGRVTVTPLVKPNALLLIGWGEALESTKQLILKLDQPTPANAQFEVIPLKHAVATDVQTQLTGLFKSKEGLAPLIQASADSRINAIIVQASPRDMAEIKLLIDQLDVPMGSMIQHAKIFTMKYSIAADVAKSLQQALTPPTRGPNASIQLLDRDGKPLVTSGILGASQITVNDRNNTIVVSASPENLNLIEKLIEQMDTPGAIAKIKIFPVKNGDAASMVDTLRSLLPTPAAGSQSTTQLSSSPDETALLPLRFTVDARGNNIIAVGSEGDLKIVEALIFRLDESDKMQRKSTVYQLKNAPAVDVALAINEFLRSKRQVEIAAPGANNPFEQLEKEVVVVPEPVQNKLILSATPRYYDEISQLIEQLDQQPPQVMIQVMIAEITLGNTDEFGVEWGLQDSVLFDRSLLGGLVTRPVTRQTSTPAGVVTENTQEILAGTNTPGFNFNNTEPLGNSGAPLGPNQLQPSRWTRAIQFFSRATQQ